MLLVEEVERLHVDLWHGRPAVGEGEPAGDLPQEEQRGLAAALRARVRARARRTQSPP